MTLVNKRKDAKAQRAKEEGTLNALTLIVGARSSPLAQVQVQEVLAELRSHQPHIQFNGIYVESQGDKDQKTSLRSIDKTDFFTKEIDDLLLSGDCRIAIHSAKDLPEPLPEGLSIVCLTRGLDPSDSLVLNPGVALEDLAQGAVIATSSVRREEAVKQLRSDVTFIDIRGTIAQRLAVLEKGEADGVVLAEAALIRLGLTHLNRVKLPGDTVPFQGQLAVMARSDDMEMRELFACIDSRMPRALYLGLEVPENFKNESVTHCPLIAIVPRLKNDPNIQQAFAELDAYTHLLFTSKSAVSIFFTYAPYFGVNVEDIRKKCVVAIGHATAKKIQSFGLEPALVAQNETSEGIIEILSGINLQQAYLFWPHAALSRPVIVDWLKAQSVRHRDCVFYDTASQRPPDLPDLSRFSEIMFTSPSTVDAFVEFYGAIPREKKLTCIGPVTAQHLAARALACEAYSPG